MTDEILEEVWKAKEEISLQYNGDFESYVVSIKEQASQIRGQLAGSSINPEQDTGGQRSNNKTEK